MAKDAEWRRRVERLIQGDVRPEHFARLLVALRFRTFGAASIAELGHFIGHADERDSGLVTNEARDFFFFLPFHTGVPHEITLRDVPSDFPKIMTRQLARMAGKDIQSSVGLPRKSAEAVLKNLWTRFRPLGNKRLSLIGSIDKQESAVIEMVLGRLIARAAFRDDDLIRDFVHVLEKNGLSQPGERDALASLKGPLSIFAIASMHQTHLALPYGESADLYAGTNGDGQTLQVQAVAPIHVPNMNGKLLISVSMFSTSLAPSDWCSPELLNLPDDGNLWHIPIEMSPELRLVPV